MLSFLLDVLELCVDFLSLFLIDLAVKFEDKRIIV